MLDTQTIKDRYDKGDVTDEQLGRYVCLHIITEEEAAEIRGETVPEPGDSIATADLDPTYREGMNSYA